MDIYLGDETSSGADSESHGDLLVEAGTPVRLRVVVGDDEELTLASLFLRGRSSASATAEFEPPSITSDVDDFSASTWVTADWGSGRSLRSLSLESSSGLAGSDAAASEQQVMIKIARGGSGWYSPPGPHGFELHKDVEVTVSFPDTVADRVMLELIRKGAPDPRALVAPAGDGVIVPVSFSHVARDLSVRLLGHGVLFDHPGQLVDGSGGTPPAPDDLEPAEGEVEVVGLLDALLDRLGTPLRGQEFTLELGAKAAGLMGLRWVLQVDTHLETFVTDDGPTEPEATLALGWSTPVEHHLADIDALVASLRVTASWSPSAERIALAPDPDPALEPAASGGLDPMHRGVAGLLRPRYQQAQGFTAPPPGPLVGVDLWVRAPQPALALELVVDIVEDAGGRPGLKPLASMTVSLAAGQERVGPRPGWLTIDLPEPLTIEAERWWIVARVDDGELAWFLTTPAPAPDSSRRPNVTGPRQRRDEGPWFEREASDPHSWAVTRLRIHEPTPAPLPSIELLVDDEAFELIAQVNNPRAPGVGVKQPVVLELPVSASATTGSRLALRARSPVAGQLTVSQLDLRWRPWTPPVLAPEAADAAPAEDSLGSLSPPP